MARKTGVRTSAGPYQTSCSEGMSEFLNPTGAGDHGSLVMTAGALHELASPDRPGPGLSAGGTAKAVRPTQLRQVGTAGFLSREPPLKLGQGA